MFFFVFCAFMDLDFVLVHLDVKKELSQYPAILSLCLVNNTSTCIFYGEIQSWSFMGFKGLTFTFIDLTRYC